MPPSKFEANSVKNGVFQNSCLECLNVHSSTTPSRVFFKPPIECVTGHLRIPLQLDMNHSNGCYQILILY